MHLKFYLGEQTTRCILELDLSLWLLPVMAALCHWLPPWELLYSLIFFFFAYPSCARHLLSYGNTED